jgi:hypothetical protein
MNRIYYCLLCIVLLLACAQGEKQDIPQILINVDEEQPITLSTLFDEIIYVPLETQQDVLVGYSLRTRVSGQKLYLLSGGVMIFDMQTGAFLSGIYHPGRGPGEWLWANDMLVNEKEKCIELLDFRGHKVVRYGLDGQFIDEFKTDFLSVAFYKHGEKYLFYNANSESSLTDHRLIRYNPVVASKKIEAQYFPIDEHLATYYHMTDNNNFVEASELSFHASPSSIIYKIDKDFNISPKYHIDFKAYQMPSAFLQGNFQDVKEFIDKVTELGYPYNMYYAFENETTVALPFKRGASFYWAFYNKKEQRTLLGSSFRDDFHFSNDMTIEGETYSIMADDTHMYFLLPAHQLITLVEKENNDFLTKHPEIEAIYHAPGFSEQSNPILVKCRFRK